MVQNFIENPLSKIKGVNGLLQCKTDGIIPEKMLLGILSFLNDKYESKYEVIFSKHKLVFYWKLSFSVKWFVYDTINSRMAFESIFKEI